MNKKYILSIYVQAHDGALVWDHTELNEEQARPFERAQTHTGYQQAFEGLTGQRDRVFVPLQAPLSSAIH
ncbi:hypothetical protein SAMN06265795_10943 [Noviherbaspirillum humi]|uniref:Uncharacterized protein n=1 Tax=Noviherbaspirillum humi TaxID=1688639 RepID=A0A239ID55_9BURK|nr:hypothetical protein [Noviherbaspirillum humi]SNS91168.1 hypothetical protein SAMN06265795_10943 [Noviherbaspirillum humi]